MVKENELAEIVNEPPTGFLTVGIGASAGGIQALKEFFEEVPADSGIAYVVILHLSPNHDSKLAEILQVVSAIPVSQVLENTQIQPDHIYVVPPNQHLIITDGHIAPSVNTRVEDRTAPVDIFFRNLADTHGPRALCVVLSGTGADGSMGLKRIKESGGVAYVQSPREAEFNEMPRNAIATELVDEVLSVREIPARIMAYKNNVGSVLIVEEPRKRPEPQQQALREIFTQLRVKTGHDFSNYKRPTLLRRIERRINIRTLGDLPAYSTYLHENPDEIFALLKDLLISVTNFFRDRKAFDALKQDVLPQIFKGKSINDQVRIWVAGCATGEEAYSVAILCAEYSLGLHDAPTVQIFATDIDESAIATAREGFYTVNDAADVSPERLSRFFTRDGDRYRVKKEIREMVLFANHNFLKDPPFSRLDLVSCRNVLIYLNNVAQERVIETFHFALQPKGFLFLGTSESVEGASDLYVAYSRDHHIFQARDVSAKSYPLPESVPAFHFKKTDSVQKPDDKDSRPQRISFGELHQKLLEQYAPPSVVVNEEYDIVHMSERAGQYFEIAGGEPTQNLLKLIRPEIRLELRSALYQAVQHHTAVEARNVPLNINGVGQSLDILIRPVLTDGDMAKGYILVIFKQNEYVRPDEQSIMMASDEPVARQLEEELIRKKTQLRNAVEQYEFQAEELKASNEELQAMNEELRSAAEELETSKEELQSINEELRTVNQELKVKIDETSLVSNNLQNLINSADVGTIFLDRSFGIRLYTPAVLDIFNLKASDYGRPITDITHKLHYDQLLHDAETVLEKLTVVEREISTLDHRFFMMRLLPYRTSDDRINGVVITFFDITRRKESEKALQQSEERLRLLIESAKDYAIMTMTPNREVVTWSTGAETMMGYAEPEMTGRSSDILFTPEDREQKAPEFEAKKSIDEGRCENERWHVRKDGSRFWGSGSVSPLRDTEQNIVGFVKIMRDLTERKQTEEAIRQAEETYRIQLVAQVDERTAELKESKGLLQSVLDSSLDMIQVFEAVRNASGTITDFRWILNNHSSQKVFGNVIGESLKTLNPGVVEEGIFASFKRVSETGAPEVSEIYYAHEQFDGWFQQSVVKLGDGVVTTTADISKRKLGELEIRSGKEFLQSIIDNSLDVIQVFDAVRDHKNNIVDFTWLINNSAGVRQNGDVIGKSLLTHNPGVVEAHIFERMVEVVRTGTPYVTEQYYAAEQFDGNWFYLALVKHEDGIIMTTRDITPQKRAEVQIMDLKDALTRRTTEKYLSLFNSIEQGFCILEVLFNDQAQAIDCRFLEVNPAFEKQAGMMEVLGKRVLELMPNHEQYWFDFYGEVARTGKAGHLDQHAASLGRWFDVYAFRVGTPDEHQVAVLFNDITVRRQNEEAQRYLLRLSDAINPLADPLKIKEAALQTLKEHLNTDRTFYAEDLQNAQGRFWLMDPIMQRHEHALSPGLYPLESFGSISEELLAGHPVVFKNVQTDPGIAPDLRETLERLPLQALVALPLIKDDKFMAVLGVHELLPREWTSTELDVIKETAERTWAAVERARVEQALQESEERYRTTLEADVLHRTTALMKTTDLLHQAEDLANMGSWEYDIPTGNLTWSEGMYNLLQVEDGAQLTPEIYINLARDDHKPLARQLVDSIKGTGRAVQDAILPMNIAGEKRIVKIKLTTTRSDDGTPLRSLGVDLDITASEEKERKLAEQSHFINSTNAALPDILFVMDLHSKQLVYINHSFEEKMGYTAEQIAAIKTPLMDIIADEDRPKMLAHLEEMKSLADGEVQEVEYRLIAADGNLHWFRDRNAVFRREKDGSAKEKIGIAQDITEAKRAGEALKESNISLQYANENLKQFASIASHDLQEPLRKLKLFASVLKKFQASLPDEGKEVIDKLELTSDRMSQLIREVLQYSKIAYGSREFTQTDLDGIFKRVMDDLELLIHETHATIYYDNPLPGIEAIPLQMNQLLYNLLSNALKFRREGTPPEVTIKASVLNADKVENFQALKPGKEYLEIIFTDNGIGFEEQYAEQIFQIFERLHSVDEFEGTGVGLALCKKIIENHSGHIYAAPGQRAGAVFHIILPFRQESQS